MPPTVFGPKNELQARIYHHFSFSMKKLLGCQSLNLDSPSNLRDRRQILLSFPLLHSLNKSGIRKSPRCSLTTSRSDFVAMRVISSRSPSCVPVLPPTFSPKIMAAIAGTMNSTQEMDGLGNHTISLLRCQGVEQSKLPTQQAFAKAHPTNQVRGNCSTTHWLLLVSIRSAMY